MAIRKSLEETVVVSGERAEVLHRLRDGLSSNGFKAVKTTEAVGQVEGKFKKATTVGEVLVTATPRGPGEVQLVFRTTANVDNIFALFSSPNKKIMGLAKAALA